MRGRLVNEGGAWRLQGDVDGLGAQTAVFVPGAGGAWVHAWSGSGRTWAEEALAVVPLGARWLGAHAAVEGEVAGLPVVRCRKKVMVLGAGAPEVIEAGMAREPGGRFIVGALELPSGEAVGVACMEEVWGVIDGAEVNLPVAQVRVPGTNEEIAQVIQGGRVSLAALRAVIEQALAASWAVDASVEVRLHGGRGPSPLLRVSRFEGAVVVEDDGGLGVRLDRDATVGLSQDQGPVRLEALALEDARRRVTLQERSPGVWSLDGLSPGVWQVVGWAGARCAYRPRLVEIPGERSPASPLADAVVRPLVESRRESLEHLMDTLADDPAHPDWPAVLAYLHDMEAIPPTSFNLCTALARHPRAAALALLLTAQHGDAASVWRGLLRMPCSVASIPLPAWSHAAHRLHSHAPDACRSALAALGHALASLAPAMQPLLLRVASTLHPHTPSPTTPSPAERRALLEELQEHQRDLGRDHAEARWPQWTRLEATHQTTLAAVQARAGRELVEALREIPCERASGFKKPAMLAPVLAAALLLGYATPSEEDTRRLRQIEAFDPGRFHAIMANAVRLLAPSVGGA